MPSVHELIARRRKVAAQIQTLQEELQRLDDAVYSAFENVAAMFAPPPESQRSAKLEPPPRMTPWEIVRGGIKGAMEEIESPSGERRKLMPGVVHVLAGLQRPVKTRELLDHLTALGIEVGGKNPTNNLAAHLSSMDIVESTPEGWVLKARDR